ncbi:MAG: hypothetical protein QOJ02_2459 [Acidobacteriota bacterium]|jgi:hypothetical protein|nr:hypothetical protein [Acidobacteriota bacterium]
MATKKAVKSEESKAGQPGIRPELPEEEEETLSAELRQETDALINVAEKLERATRSFAKQQQEFHSVRSMQQEMQGVLTRIIEGIEKASAASPIEGKLFSGKPQDASNPFAGEYYLGPQGYKPSNYRESSECGCGCTHPGCCCYEIVLERLRGIQPQGLLEPADAGAAPAVTNDLEVRLFASIDNIGVLIPSLTTTMQVPVPSVVIGGGPGRWLPLGHVIGRVCLPRNTSRTVTVDFQAAEIDEGIETLAGNPEVGEASGSITLECGCSKIYPPASIDLSFDRGDVGGGAPGAISIAFFARRVCC